jgi:hypothetical protein
MQLYRSPTESRLVYMKRDDGVEHIFLATTVADLGGMFSPATETRHLHPNNDFTGLVFFSELDGDYGEVWEQRGGKPIRQMQVSLPHELDALPAEGYTVLVNTTHLPMTLTRSGADDSEKSPDKEEEEDEEEDEEEEDEEEEDEDEDEDEDEEDYDEEEDGQEEEEEEYKPWPVILFPGSGLGGPGGYYPDTGTNLGIGGGGSGNGSGGGGSGITFPDAEAIKKAMKNEFDKLWEETKEFAFDNARTHTVRELGGLVFWNRQTGKYRLERVPDGKPVALLHPGDRATIGFTKPSNDGEYDNYCVAFFHTHYPTEYAASGCLRKTGNSDDDNDIAAWLGVPGLVYDYAMVDIIGRGYKIDAPAIVKPFGLNRRVKQKF